MLEDIRIGAPALGRDGRRLGELQRLVVGEPDHHLTHLVIDPGLIESGEALAPGGWEKPRARVVPVALVASVTNDAVTLTCDHDEFVKQPLFEQEHFAEVTPPAEPNKHASWWSQVRVGEVISYLASGVGLGGAPYLPSTTAVTLNEPAGSAAIAEGTSVWRLATGNPAGDEEEIGVVERVLVDEATQAVSALVVHRNDLTGRLVTLPITAVTALDNDVVHVDLTDGDLDNLPLYDAQ
ncbi:MAG: PRC-barrel domain-containing protein [Ktedonobacterales bacterium]